MKKEYVSPETTVYQLDVEQPLLTGSPMTMEAFGEEEYTPTKTEKDWWFD